LALWQLKALLGVDLEMKIDCRGALADYEGGMTSQIQAGTLAENTTMKQLDIQERMLEQNIKLKRAANLPSLVASINYQFTAMDESFNLMHYRWNPSSAAVLSLNIPIFSGGKRRADIKQAKIDLSNIQLQRENAERQLRTALMSYYSNMQTNLKQYHASSQNIATAKRGYDIAVKRYEVGSGTLVEIDNSQLAYTQAELSRSTSIYDYLINKVSMEKITGTPVTK
jgi:outer membrane protein TolC